MLENLATQAIPLGPAPPSRNLMEEDFSVLVLDDEEDVRETMCAMISSLGVSVEATGDAASFFEKLGEGGHDVIILDLMMPGCDGLEVLSRLVPFKKSKIIICSGTGVRVLDTVSLSAQSLGLDVIGILQKPLRRKSLKTMLEHARQTRSSPPPPMETANRRPKITRPMLIRALETREIICFLQPKMHLSNGTVYGFEALARWQHPEFGMILPDVFISKVSEFGLDYELSITIIEQALEVLAELSNPDISIAVNTPASVLSHPQFEGVVASLLSRHGLMPRHLFLEVTEVGDSCISHAELESLMRLSLKGHPLSIDDFGTGASSLERLVRIPFDELKIDRMFMSGLESSDPARGLVRNLVEIAKRFGMSVTVEGVETNEPIDILKGLGCDSAQGYVISRPMPASALRDWMTSFNERRKADPACACSAGFA